MIWVLVGVSILFLLWVIDHKDNAVDVVHFAIVMCAVVGIYLLGNSLVASNIPATYSSAAGQPIISLDTSIGPSGSFVLGSGRIDTDAYYFYYRPTADKGYTLDQSRAKEAVIYENAPLGQGYTVTRNPTLASYIWSLHYSARVDIHIPAGSIVREYQPNIGGGTQR